MNSLFSIYIHIPFCKHRCSYCDFNTYAGIEPLIPRYVQALRQELEFVSFSARNSLPVHTLFFGGGTPSLLSAREFEKIFSTIRKFYSLTEDVEITIEANPGMLSLVYLQDLRSMGVNRLSLGMQSGNSGELRLLERQHDLTAVTQSVDWARQAGYENLNLDLIFGIPEQTLESWRQTLQLAISLAPEHLSLYALTLEHGTPLAYWVERGLVPASDDDLAADMYEMAAEVLEEAGYSQYEISNWAKWNSQGELLACRHNLQYWRFLPYLGFGAGAHGFANQTRTANVLAPGLYIERMSVVQRPCEMSFPASPAAEEIQAVDRQRAIGEYMMMGLRLVQEGISEQDFQERFENSLETEFGAVIAQLEKKGLLEYLGDKRLLRLSRRGRLLGNQVFCEFI